MVTSRRRVLAVANPRAGGTGTAERALEQMRERADVEEVHPDGDDDLAAALVRAGGRRVVVVGGDGVHAVARVLRRLDLLREVGPVALVPAGTGNDLARTLGLPLDDVERSVELALGGEAREVEMLVDDTGGVVVNAVHVGVGAEAGALAAKAKVHLRKVRLGKVAYPAGALAAGLTADPDELHVTVDGELLHQGPTLLVAVGIGTSVGGGTPLSPQANPFDGLMDVTVSTAAGPLTRIGYAASVSAGTHLDRDDTITARGRTLLIESADGRPFRANADGEISGPLVRREWQVVDGAWQLVVPSRRV